MLLTANQVTLPGDAQHEVDASADGSDRNNFDLDEGSDDVTKKCLAYHTLASSEGPKGSRRRQALLFSSQATGRRKDTTQSCKDIHSFDKLYCTSRSFLGSLPSEHMEVRLVLYMSQHVFVECRNTSSQRVTFRVVFAV